jgi:hypothetical protein
MKYLCTTLAILSILEMMIIFGLYLRVIRMTSEIVYQQEQIMELKTDLHIILNNKDLMRCE